MDDGHDPQDEQHAVDDGAAAADGMDVLIVTTQSHRELADEFFHPTLQRAGSAVVKERRLDVEGEGRYGSASWQTGVTAKLHWALEHLSSLDPDEPFVLSDVDIQFFDGFSTAALRRLIVEDEDVDVLFQKEHRSPDSIEVNTGFYVARNTPWLRQLLEDAIEHCNQAETMNDQTAINALLRPDELGTTWGFLPFAYYARSQGFPPRGEIVLHHANFSGTIAEKIGQLNRVRRYVDGGLVDRARASVGEAWDYATSGKLRTSVRERVKGRRRRSSRPAT